MIRRALLATLAAGCIQAATPGIAVMQPKAFATAPGAPTAMIVLSLHNTGGSADTLLGGSTPVAGKVEMHGTTMQAGVMSMRPLAAVEVQPGATVEFRSGGNHLMLLGLTGPLVAGAVIPLTLKFARAGDVKVSVPVLPLAAHH